MCYTFNSIIHASVSSTFSLTASFWNGTLLSFSSHVLRLFLPHALKRLNIVSITKKLTGEIRSNKLFKREKCFNLYRSLSLSLRPDGFIHREILVIGTVI